MRLRVIVAGILALWASLAAADYGFTVRYARLTRYPDALALTAMIDYRFSQAMIDALEAGVPLTLTVKTRIYQPRLVWDKLLWRHDLDFKIQYYPLAKIYRVIDESNNFQRSFAQLEAALEALGKLDGIVLPMTEDRFLSPGCYAELTVKLNLNRLPWPLRVPAYFSPKWRLRSPPYRWPLSD
ncbi:MAG: DUF4390 domain-containing protein [Methylohalobius sp.]|nr:DUF4390 domain-containing protein [Methylohalobius sp.]